MRKHSRVSLCGDTLLNTFWTAILKRYCLLAILLLIVCLPAVAAETGTGETVAQNDNFPLPPAAVYSLMSGRAEKGDAGAMLSLGRLYEHGHGVARNYSKALEWYSKAAGQGLPEGYYNLGVCYEVGMGTASDMAKAGAAYAKAAELGLPIAIHKMAGMYLKGMGVPQHTATAMNLLMRAADLGLPQACYDLGQVYMQGLYTQKLDYAAALKYFSKGAEKGSLQSMASLAAYFDDGTPVRRNYVKALKWYLILKAYGVQGESLSNRISGLETKMGQMQIDNAKADAAAWLKEFPARERK